MNFKTHKEKKLAVESTEAPRAYGKSRNYIRVIILLFCLLHFPAYACTLWSTLNKTDGGAEVLVAKTRDRQAVPFPQTINFVNSNNPEEYDYVGLSQGTPTAGVNAGGLIVISATIDSLPKDVRRKGSDNLVETLLRTFGSVQEIITHGQYLLAKSNRMFLLLADTEQTALVEMGPDETFSTHIVQQGNSYHTNHYVFSQNTHLNPSDPNEKLQKSLLSSFTRYNRIQSLMDHHNGPFTLNDFIRFSEDQHDGPRNSIFRLGSGNDNAVRTVASFIVHEKQGEPIILRIKYLTNPDPLSQNFIIKNMILTPTDSHHFKMG
jgi:hypothetical protein